MRHVPLRYANCIKYTLNNSVRHDNRTARAPFLEQQKLCVNLCCKLRHSLHMRLNIFFMVKYQHQAHQQHLAESHLHTCTIRILNVYLVFRHVVVTAERRDLLHVLVRRIRLLRILGVRLVVPLLVVVGSRLIRHYVHISGCLHQTIHCRVASVVLRLLHLLCHVPIIPHVPF